MLKVDTGPHTMGRSEANVVGVGDPTDSLRWGRGLQSSPLGKRCIQAIVIAIGVTGCAQSGETVSAIEPSTAGAEMTVQTDVASAVAENAVIAPSYDAETLAALPAAPWADAQLAVDAAPAALLTAWNDAENREWCAPVIPRGVTAAPARATTVAGGWALEFDERGARGMRADGRACARCGRASYGVAGTAMSTDELADVDTDAMPAPSFDDGSTAQLTAEDGVAAATITIQGQGCVYQVWSFLGEDHLRSLVDDLRFVSVSVPSTDAVAARD